MVEMVELSMNKIPLNAYRYDILANEYRIQQKYPNAERDSVEYLKHFNDNLWAYQIAHSTREGYTQLTPAGEEYLDNVFIIYCDVVGIHQRTLKPLDGSEGDPEITYYDEDEDE